MLVRLEEAARRHRDVGRAHHYRRARGEGGGRGGHRARRARGRARACACRRLRRCRRGDCRRAAVCCRLYAPRITIPQRHKCRPDLQRYPTSQRCLFHDFFILYNSFEF